MCVCVCARARVRACVRACMHVKCPSHTRGRICLTAHVTEVGVDVCLNSEYHAQSLDKGELKMWAQTKAPSIAISYWRLHVSQYA